MKILAVNGIFHRSIIIKLQHSLSTCQKHKIISHISFTLIITMIYLTAKMHCNIHYTNMKWECEWHINTLAHHDRFAYHKNGLFFFFFFISQYDKFKIKTITSYYLRSLQIKHRSDHNLFLFIFLVSVFYFILFGCTVRLNSDSISY